MATVVIMPRQGQSVESCIITAFNKKVGDAVEAGEILFSYETDKSSFEEPAPVAGKILAIFREEGDDVPCLENVLVIGNDGEDFSGVQYQLVGSNEEYTDKELQLFEKEFLFMKRNTKERKIIISCLWIVW